MAPVSELALRERKKAETRVAISRAAMRLAVANGPDGTTVDEIAAAAGVSPRTVFNYFATKEEAILGFDPDRSVELGRLVAQRPQWEAPLTALRAAFADIATGSAEVAETARIRSSLVRNHPQLYASHVASYLALERALIDAIEARTGLDHETSLYPRLAVVTAIAAFRVALDQAGPGDGALLAAIDEAFSVLTSGLRAPLARGDNQQ
jgi:AcrR family transcriptional regulator